MTDFNRTGVPIALCHVSPAERSLLEATAEQLRPLYLAASWVSLDSNPDWKKLSLDLESNGTRVIVAFGGGPRSPAARLAAATFLPVLALPPLAGATSLGRIRNGLRTSRDRAPVALLATGLAGARNAALFAAALLAISDRVVAAALRKFREQQTSQVLAATLD